VRADVGIGPYEILPYQHEKTARKGGFYFI